MNTKMDVYLWMRTTGKGHMQPREDMEPGQADRGQIACLSGVKISQGPVRYEDSSYERE